MKKVIIIILFTSLSFLTACQNSENTHKTSYKSITSEKAYKMIENNQDLLILDVRSIEEYNEEHIKNSINIPVNEIGNRFKEEVTENLDKTILIYCRSGARAKQASELLVDLGYKNVIEFGGIIDWKYNLVTD